MISIERLRQMLEYDGERLRWKVNRPGTAVKGSFAGCVVEYLHGLKYIRLKIGGHAYQAHRVISWRYNKWVARIRVNGSLIHLGSFAEFSDAVAARKTAEAKYGFHPNHGQSRRMQQLQPTGRAQ